MQDYELRHERGLLTRIWMAVIEGDVHAYVSTRLAAVAEQQREIKLARSRAGIIEDEPEQESRR